MTTPTLNLNHLNLAEGSHPDRTNGLCIMEAVAWFAGEPHSDHPECVSPVLGAFGRQINDLLPTDKRQLLKPLIPLLPGTAGDGFDETRGYLALDWLVRTYTPAWLDLASLTAEARSLRELRRIVDFAAAQAAGPVVSHAKTRAAAWVAAGAAAWVAAWVAARDAARVAARDAARDAVGNAARDAAWVAARAAAGNAARAAARDAAGNAAWVAAGAAAWDAAWVAARDAARAAAGNAARAAAWDALKPTVDTLQLSAIDLLTKMTKPQVQS